MSIPDEKQIAWYDALLAGSRMAKKVNDELGLGATGGEILTCGEKIGVSMMIEQNGGNSKSGGGGFSGGSYEKGPKGSPTDYKCTNCGGAVVDCRNHKDKENAPDFKCSSCKNEKGFYTGWWLKQRDGSFLTPDQLFGVHDFSNAGLEAAATPPDDDLPFAIPSYFQNWWEEEDGDI